MPIRTKPNHPLKFGHSPRRGFTLIELLVAATILVLLVGGSIAAFFRFQNRQLVQTTATNIKSLLEVAQTKARNKEVPKSCLSSTLLLAYYEVYVQGTTVKVRAVCAEDGKNAQIANTPQADMPSLALVIPADVTVNFPDSVGFFPLQGGVRSSSGNSSIIITVTKAPYTATFTIEVDGNISDIVITNT